MKLFLTSSPGGIYRKEGERYPCALDNRNHYVELEGEAIDPNYQRFISGLGLTEIRILPHFQELSNLTLDGLDIIGDIALADSKVYPFYALTDGAYIYIEDDKINLYGEAYYFDNGEMVNICKEGQTLPI